MNKTTTKPRTRSKRFTLGRNGLAKLSEVEGIAFTPEMKRDFQDFDRKGLSASERRKAIIRKYGKA